MTTLELLQLLAEIQDAAPDAIYEALYCTLAFMYILSLSYRKGSKP